MKEYTNGWLDQQVEKLPQHIQDIWNKWTWPPESFDGMLKDADNRVRIAVHLTGCCNHQVLLQNMREIDQALREMFAGTIPQDIAFFREMMMEAITMFAKDYNAKGLCHDTLTHMVCFCD